jgi:hypothetical protein
MVIIEFDEGEGGQSEGALEGLLAHIAFLEKRGFIRDLYMTTDVIEVELDQLEPASA